jgi:N-terminal domain of (some) glycogen debranching enzymes
VDAVLSYAATAQAANAARATRRYEPAHASLSERQRGQGVAVLHRIEHLFPRGRLRTLKHGHTFAMSDRRGDIVAWSGSSDGIYHNDTRFCRGSSSGSPCLPAIMSPAC